MVAIYNRGICHWAPASALSTSVRLTFLAIIALNVLAIVLYKKKNRFLMNQIDQYIAFLYL